VNTRLVGETLPSVASILLKFIVTSALGMVSNETVNVAVPPFSLVVKPLIGLTVMPAGMNTSLSVFIIVTSSGLMPM